ncbi:putative ferric-chelate reductase 1 homolog isoform X2 [Diorhabda sublineata]|uniref:putative ferric-chelate reductase 1 homolog isoform X2 n=1 Tax=Diorhabda sublineata TaxID=1163346 RepID=UPI0024E13E8F|nr:putative ferric-chelate reductase 1 homolog isoform X2 [Diorhabda sublineata]XP_056640682.1 putative ferric-chelate reductase 1 homolog isoform X2 [Diorhabda sublineata]
MMFRSLNMKLHLLLFIFSTTRAYPDGAPIAVCNNLAPLHGSALTQQITPPYTLYTEPHKNVIMVSLNSTIGSGFKGFIIQGRTPNGTIVGSFKLPDGVPYHTLDCSGPDDSVTHSSPAIKNRLDLIWLPPVGYEGPVIFNSTVVHDFSTFWVGLESEEIHIKKSSRAVSLYDGCGMTKYCHGSPIDCIEKENCKIAVAVTPLGDVYDFEIKATENAAWVGVGLSDDALMGNDSVIECVKENGTVNTYMSWTGINPYRATRVPKKGVLLLNGKSEGEELYCKVRRAAVTVVQGVTFDLKKKLYHILLASGSTVTPTSVTYHNLECEATPDPQVLEVNRNLPQPSPQVKNNSMVLDPFYQGCGSSKLCFGFPEGCVDTQNCNGVTAVTSTGDKTFIFEVRANQNAAWVGVGLSDDTRMGDDSVIECVKDVSGMNAYMSWTGINPYRATRLPDPHLGIQLLNSSSIDDTIYCKVRRNVVTIVEGRTFDLDHDMFHLMVAVGSSVQPTTVTYHNLGVTCSAQKLSLTDTSNVHSKSTILVRLHGVFMVIGWIGTVSLGTIIARFYKDAWTGTLLGYDVWFTMHTVFTMLTWILTVVGFILIFVELEGWSAESNPHAILGTITTILCFIQPIPAYFRPSVGTPNRHIFNWFHWIVGSGAHVIAIVAMFFAVTLTKAQLNEQVYYILGGYVILHVLVHIILYSTFSWRRSILGVYILILLIIMLILVTVVAMAPQWPFGQ